MLPTSKIEEVSQNSFVAFKLAERQIDRQTDRQIDGQLQLQPHYTTTTNTKSSILCYSTLITLHYASFTAHCTNYTTITTTTKTTVATTATATDTTATPLHYNTLH